MIEKGVTYGETYDPVVVAQGGKSYRKGILDKLENQVITNTMKFNKDSCCWILLLGQVNHGCLYKLRNAVVESSAMERDLGVLVDAKLNMNQQCPGSPDGQP
ncbi:hypothetical protein DUI87_04952 [Hirundo rustica rustica]|uniref:Uncharacterized protein n=1 Tax=Hirundo rustica rustica TaxID=333673 RepID=A0A3M0KY53_HIRRU|nr:hypothetical protein DUI87_04952 [Hirundo rustica rustica]